jgi:hypothetical protein
MEDINKMQVRIIIDTWTSLEDAKPFDQRGYQSRSEVWHGDINIENDKEYLTRITMIADGQEHPICDVPFAIGSGYWRWFPPETPLETNETEELAAFAEDMVKPKLTYPVKQSRFRRLFKW